MQIARYQFNAIVRAALAAAAATVGSLGFLGGNVGSSTDSVFACFFNNALLDTRGFTAFNTGSTTTPLDVNGLPTGASTLCISTPPTSSSPGPLPPGNYYLNVYSVGQTVTATMFAACGMTLGTGVPQGDGVCIRYPVTVALGSAATQAVNFSGAMSQMPDLARDGSVTAVGQPVFSDTALAFYSQFSVLRLMDYLITNTRLDTTWSTRPGNFPMHVYGQPVSWERMVLFVNAVAAYSGSQLKGVLINIPGYADNTYVSNLASLMTSAGLSSSIQLYVDRANEQWNSSFTFYGNYLTSAMTEMNYISNYGVGSPVITSIVTNGTTATFTTSSPVTNFIPGSIGSTKTCCVVGGAFGFSVGTYASPATATSTGTNTFTVPTASIWSSSANAGAGGYVGVVFNLAANLIADGVLPDVFHVSSKWYVRLLHQDWITWNAIRPQDRFFMDLKLSGSENGGGSNSTSVEYPYAAYVNGGSATWLYGAAVGMYVTATSNSTLTAVFSQLNTTLNSTSDGQIRDHVYHCRLYGLHPMAYEGGPDLQAVPTLMISAMTDARMGTLATSLLNLWTANGGEIFCYYYASPAPFSNVQQGGWPALQSYSDTTSPKYAALIGWGASTITYSNVNGSGTGTFSITAHYQYTTREQVLSGLLGWFETGHVLDISIAIPTAGTYTLTLVGCAQAACSIALYADPSISSNGTSLGTSTIPASGGGWNSGTSADALSVTNPVTATLTAGIHTIRVVPTTCATHGTGLTQLIIS